MIRLGKRKLPLPLVLALGALLLLLVGAVLLFLLHPRFLYRRFLISDSLAAPFERTAYPETNPQVVQITADALLGDARTSQDTSLLLVRRGFPLTNTFATEDAVPLVDYNQTGLLMQSETADAFALLSLAMQEKFDKRLLIISAYRTPEEQADAIAEEGDLAAGVGESEHQIGLALDIAVKGFGGASFLKTDVGRYINQNAYLYGFIIRYPYYGVEQTDIAYEPWHIRYVGQPHATLIARNRLTLEEYLDSLEPNVFYAYENNLISLQPMGAQYTVPAEYESVTVSPDNRGNLILTFTLADDGDK